MKKISFIFSFVLAAMVIVFAIAFPVMAKTEMEDVIISGYNSGEFAVKGEIENQLQKLVVDLKTRQKKDEQLQISVIGSADMTGKATANDQLARLRAEQVAAYLQANLPEAMVHAWSKGDEGNVRQVRIKPVIYSVVPLSEQQVKTLEAAKAQEVAPVVPKVLPPLEVPVEVPATESAVDIRFIILFISILIFLLIIIIQQAKIKIKKKEAEAKAKAKAKTILEERWVEAETNGGGYEVRVIKRGDEKWYTPFMTLEDKTQPLFRADFQSAKKAVRGCAKDPRYAEQFKSLLDAGKEIRKK